MFKFNWKAFTFYFNFLGTGSSLEEVNLAAMVYKEAVSSDTTQPITSKQQEDPGKSVTVNTQPI